MIYKGSTNIEDINVGGQNIEEVYHGNTLVYKKHRLKFISAGMSYSVGHVDGNQASGFADGDGQQSPIKCLCLIRSDGAAKAVPFALYSDTANIVPTDAQISAATWVAGSYTDQYNGGVFYPRPNGPWQPAIASSESDALRWYLPGIGTRSIRNETLSQWGWPITGSTTSYSNAISSDYNVVVTNGTVKIYYQGNLVKTISDATL